MDGPAKVALPKVSLDTLTSAVEASLDAANDHIAALNLRVAELSDYAAQLELRFGSLCQVLETRTEELTGRYRELHNETRVLRRLLEESDGDADSATTSRARHLDFATEFGVVVEQDFLHAARQAAVQGGTSEPRSIAHRVAELSRAVFLDPPSVKSAVRSLPDELKSVADIEEIIRRGLAVRARAEQADSSVIWDFEAAIGAPPTTDQSIWGMGASNDPVAFVVAPAYRAGGRLFRLQTVFTFPKTGA